MVTTHKYIFDTKNAADAYKATFVPGDPEMYSTGPWYDQIAKMWFVVVFYTPVGE